MPRKEKTTPQAETFLPMKPVLYLLLLALGDGDRHGYGLKKEVVRRTDGKVRLGPATLYRSISQLAAQGLIAESGERPDPDLDDERRRYYRLTSLGRRAAFAETERLATLVAAARSMNLLDEVRTT